MPRTSTTCPETPGAPEFLLNPGCPAGPSGFGRADPPNCPRAPGAADGPFCSGAAVGPGDHAGQSKQKLMVQQL